jgi:predicted nucleic acid-binding protein
VYVLDTDTIGNALHRSGAYPHLVRKINDANPGDLWISIVTAEELIAWGYNSVRDRRNQMYPHIVNKYKILFDRINDLRFLQILPFDEAAYRQFEAIPAEVKRIIGTNDARIAATAISRSFTVVTNNEKHFRLVPGLDVENWIPAPLI